MTRVLKVLGCLIAALCAVGAVTVLASTVPAGRRLIFTLAASALQQWGIAVERGTLEDVGFFGAARMSGVRVCWAPTQCADVDTLTLASVFVPRTLELTGVCPQIDDTSPVKTATPDFERWLDLARELAAPVPHLRVALASDCGYLGLAGSELRVDASADRVEVTLASPVHGTVAVVREGGGFGFTYVREEFPRLVGTLSADNTLVFSASFGNALDPVNVTGALTVGDAVALRGRISGLLSADLDASFTSNLNARFSKLEWSGGTHRVRAEKLSIDARAPFTEIGGAVAGLGYTSDDIVLERVRTSIRCTLAGNARGCRFPGFGAERLMAPGEIELRDVRATPFLRVASTRMCAGVTEASARIWEGQVKVPSFSSCETRSPQVVRLEHIGLGPVMTRFARERVTATGHFGAEVPILWAGGALAVRNGKFRAEAPGGELRYFDEAKSLPELARKALEQLRYEKLEGSLSLNAGILSVDGRIEGRSPGLGTERPIHLNLAWEENLGTLLRALSLQSAVEDGLKSKGLL